MSRRKAEGEKASDNSYALEDEDDSNGMKTFRKAKRPRKAGEKKVARSTSRFRGVTHHCRTGRFEAHIWQEGKQIYLGGFDAEEQAALAYDLAALKFRGLDAQTNYDKSTYEQEMLQFNEVTKEEVVQTLRRQSKGFQKTSSQYRGVTRHQKGKFEARIGQMVGKKYKYLGLFTTEVEAAQAYDRESVMRKGVHAITNFDLAHYTDLLSPEDLAEAGRRGMLGTSEAGLAEEGNQVADWPEQPNEELPSEATFFHGPADAMSPMQYSLSTIENWADPPLRGYNSMPALHSVPEDCPIHGLAPAPSPATEQAKDMMPDGVTPKSIFGWQTPSPSANASPSMLQGDSSITDWALQHLEADIISCGGVLQPLTADTLLPASSTEAAEAAHDAHQEAQATQPSHLALLLSDGWLQCFHTEQ